MPDRPAIAVGAIVIDDGRLLLIRRAQDPHTGAWSVPGGRVERGELLAEAVVRELAEETGLEGVCDSLVGVVERIGDDHHWVILDYRVVLLDPNQTPVAGDDADAVAWVDLADVAEQRLVPGLAEFLHDHGIIDTIA